MGVSRVRGEWLKDREIDEAAHLHGELRFNTRLRPVCPIGASTIPDTIPKTWNTVAANPNLEAGMTMKPWTLLILTALAAGFTASAAIFQNSETLSSNNQIDDPPSSGLARTLTISTPVTVLRDLNISLDIGNATGETAWSGDLYVQLVSPAGTTVVLINRPGLSLSDTTTGYGDSGFNLTIGYGATSDIHTYQSGLYTLNGSGQLTGNWQSDGRTSATSASRSATLDTLVGENPNGTWTLLVADLANGNVAKLNSWGILGSDIAPVPEPRSTLILGVALLAGAVALRRRSSAK